MNKQTIPYFWVSMKNARYAITGFTIITVFDVMTCQIMFTEHTKCHFKGFLWSLCFTYRHVSLICELAVKSHQLLRHTVSDSFHPIFLCLNVICFTYTLPSQADMPSSAAL